MKTHLIVVSGLLGLCLNFAIATEPGPRAALPTGPQKLDFDEVVVQTLDRNPKRLDTVGIIGRENKNRSLHKKRTVFKEELASSLKELGASW